ncbi:hypothetical protein [Streptomyces beijiangensis]|uniref:Uncharacterized protein n=1 Tax=Streptomyces beijiangensis TaxID=163361 RepID=A0A939FB28_9ACTN|nr:hypothetical protein [Streptomyces beijiangensis]MBO0515278.1 hypothetical protein [Streptomyces beijiangensis]
MASLSDRPDGEKSSHPDAVARQHITVPELDNVRPEAWVRAATEWTDLAAAAMEARGHVENVLLKMPFVWQGAVAMTARVQLAVMLDELTIANRESKAAAATLDAAHSGFKLAGTWLDEATEMAKSQHLTLHDDGSVTVPDRNYPHNDPDSAGAARQDQEDAETLRTRATAALSYAADVNEHTGYELERIKKAVAYSVLDDHTESAVKADTEGAGDLNRVFSGQGGVLLPPPAPDEGSGSYDSREATDEDRAIKNKMGLYAMGSPAVLGGPQSAKNMLHYLSNTGEPLDIDVDTMLDDLPDVQKTVDAQVGANADGWKAQALAEYERTGKPVKLVQQTGWQGATASEDPDWYHAVGSFHYNTIAQVEVVPGPDGEPKTTIRYETHVYDRYNWDAQKGTPVPAMGNVSDAEMARLHQSGQAKEYDMGGQSKVHTWNG